MSFDAVKIIPGIWADGRSLPVWRYESVPGGMRPARVRDLYFWRPVLYQVLIGTDKGKWYTDYVRETTYKIFRSRIEAGLPVLVRDE
ncbi:MAG: hypothetical protein IJ840_00200 [Bacteroidales bacterium]|nr:hypothetical protein [Bacteroidales bacterium]